MSTLICINIEKIFMIYPEKSKIWYDSFLHMYKGMHLCLYVLTHTIHLIYIHISICQKGGEDIHQKINPFLRMVGSGVIFVFIYFASIL